MCTSCRALLWILLIAGAALGSGCAHVHHDSEGRTHVLGLVWLTLPPAPAADTAVAGQGIRLRALGLSMLRSELGATVVLGWQDTSFSYLLNHKMVDARGALLRTSSVEPGEKR